MDNSLSVIPAGRQSIGFVVGGSLKANLFVRLTLPAHSVQEGVFVVIKSGDWQFYGLVTDLLLVASDPRYAENPGLERFLPQASRLLSQQTLFTNLEVLPALMVESGPEFSDPRYPEWCQTHPEDAHPMPMPGWRRQKMWLQSSECPEKVAIL